MTTTNKTAEITDERAEYLRKLYSEHVKTRKLGDDWRGPCLALVPKEIADDVEEAMNFMGSIVDSKCTVGDKIGLRSKGYWAHGF